MKTASEPAMPVYGSDIHQNIGKLHSTVCFLYLLRSIGVFGYSQAQPTTPNSVIELWIICLF